MPELPYAKNASIPPPKQSIRRSVRLGRIKMMPCLTIAASGKKEDGVYT